MRPQVFQLAVFLYFYPPSMGKKLHIISFNVPYPPDYGGIIDVYYKLKSLSESGIDIILHCFQYGRDEAKTLEEFCTKVHYYSRSRDFINLLSTQPFIVNTRKNKKLLSNLLEDVAPILFEGLHTCYYLDSPLLGAYHKIVRAHNIEHQYYRYLAKSEPKRFKRIYFSREASKLQCFEKRLKVADNILPISPEDYRYFNNRYGKSTFIPAFHPFEKVTIREGIGEYILFHGNLGVAENQRAIKYLIDKIFTEVTIPFYIAGKNPPEWLTQKSIDTPHINLIADPDKELMDELIRDAQICLIPTFQPTGLKLKLLASLFIGRHCITNSPMVENTGLQSLCNIANNADDMLKLIQEKMEEEFTFDEIIERKRVLETQFSNHKNAEKIIELF